MDKIQDYYYVVHRNVMRRKLYLGIPLFPLLILLYLTFIFVFDFQQYYFLIFTVVIWLLLKYITDKDEYIIEIFLGIFSHKQFYN